MTLEELKAKQVEMQAALAEAGEAMKANTAKARELNEQNRRLIEGRRAVQADLAKLQATIRELEAEENRKAREAVEA